MKFNDQDRGVDECVVGVLQFQGPSTMVGYRHCINLLN